MLDPKDNANSNSNSVRKASEQLSSSDEYLDELLDSISDLKDVHSIYQMSRGAENSLNKNKRNATKS